MSMQLRPVVPPLLTLQPCVRPPAAPIIPSAKRALFTLLASPALLPAQQEAPPARSLPAHRALARGAPGALTLPFRALTALFFGARGSSGWLLINAERRTL